MSQRQIYSYQRFSSPEQARGGSIQRQDDYARRVAKEYGLTLNEDLIITDRGLSAFHAQHKESGAYGAFLEAVKQKRVATGSILIVENFDRLSRENARKAQRDIDDLIDNGITIITAHDNQLYNTESIAKNPYQIFVMVATMIRAHEESLTKQKRSVSFIHQQVKRFNKEGIADIAGAVPFWLDRLADKQGFVFNKYQSTMQLIIDRFLSGTGLMTISRELAELGIKSPSGNDRWGVTTIGSVLDNTALYGRKKFKLTYLKDGIEVVEEHDLQNYYPALISKDEFEQIKLKRKKRKGSRESYGEVVQLLTGYGKGRTVCGVCGSGLGSQTQKQKNRAGAYTKTVRRLHCLRHKERGDCCSSIIQDNIEATVIDQLEVFVDLSLLSGKVTNEAVYQTQLDDIEARIKLMVQNIMMADNAEMMQMLTDKRAELEVQRSELKAIVNSSKSPSVSQSDIDEFQLVVDKAKDLKNTTERKIIKSLLMNSMKQLRVWMRPNKLDCYYVELDFQSGQTLGVNIKQGNSEVLTAYVYQTGLKTPDDVEKDFIEAQQAIASAKAELSEK